MKELITLEQVNPSVVQKRKNQQRLTGHLHPLAFIYLINLHLPPLAVIYLHLLPLAFISSHAPSFISISLHLPSSTPLAFTHLHLPSLTFIYLYPPLSTSILPSFTFTHFPASTLPSLHVPSFTFSYLHLPPLPFIYLYPRFVDRRQRKVDGG